MLELSRDRLLELVARARTRDQARRAILVGLEWLDLHPDDEEMWDEMLALCERFAT